MILLLGDGEMTEKSSEYHHNLSKDRLLQNKLLEVDDKTLLESLKDVYRTKCRISSARHGKDSLCHEITGWIPPDITFRKTWKEKEKGKEGTKEFIHWRDARSKANHIDKYDNFVFSHYRDTKKYILQYREQHSNHDPSNSAAKKRLQSNNYIPPQQNNDVLPITSTNQRANNHSYNFQYTRRDSQKPAKCRSASSPSDSSTSATDTNTVTVSELDSHRERTRTIGSMSRNSRAEKSESSTFSVARVTVPTPVLVPHSNGGGKQSSSVNTGTQTPTMKGEGQQNGPRTLDTLACIADDKQQQTHEQEQATSDESEHSDAVSIGRLSTTCLSADVSVKVKPKLEPSCTYHVFPAELMITKNQPIVPNSMMWNPAKSSLEFRKRKDSDKKANEAGMNSPFKMANDPGNMHRLNLTSQDNEYLHQLKTRPKEIIVTRTHEFPPLATHNRCLVHSNTTLIETDEMVDLPPSVFFQVHGISSKSSVEKSTLESENRSNTNLEALKKYDAKKVLMLHKHGRSAPPEAHRILSASSGTKDSSSLPPTDTNQPRPLTDDTYAFLAGQHPNKPRGSPYFKFWNSGAHGRSGVSASRRAKFCTNLNLKHLAELVLAEQDAQNPELCHMSNALSNGPSIASGSPLFEKKLEELTWREQLDVLRHIKPRTKSKRRKQRLYFFKENGEFEVQGTGDYFSVERYPEEVDPMNKEQVSQQRRIRHLVEQSKLKFARFSSLSGAPHTIDREFQNFSSVASSFTDLSTAGSFDAASLTDFQSVSSVSGEDAFAEDSQKQLNKSSLRTKYCPSLIWRLPKNQFSYATLSYPHRSQTCFHGDRRL